MGGGEKTICLLAPPLVISPERKMGAAAGRGFALWLKMSLSCCRRISLLSPTFTQLNSIQKDQDNINMSPQIRIFSSVARLISLSRNLNTEIQLVLCPFNFRLVVCLRDQQLT